VVFVNRNILLLTKEPTFLIAMLRWSKRGILYGELIIMVNLKSQSY